MAADDAAVFYLPESVAIKKLAAVTPEQISEAFDRRDLQVYTDSEAFRHFVFEQDFSNSVLLLMSSGTYGGLDLKELGEKIARTGEQLH